MSRHSWDRCLEIRKVSEAELHHVVESLKYDWKVVMVYVPKNPLDIDNAGYEFKYTVKDVNTIQDNASKCCKNPVAVFLDEWKTSGQIRPTLDTLHKLVTKLGLYRAMVEMALLIGDPVPNRPTNGPGALVDTDVTGLLEREQLEQDLENMSTIESDQLVMCSLHNQNMNGPQNQGGISKQFPNFILPEIQLSTRLVLNPINTPSNNQNTVRIPTAELPAVLQQADLNAYDTRQSNLTTPSVTSFDSSLSSQDEGDSSLPIIVSDKSENGKQQRIENRVEELTNQEFSLPLVVMSLNNKGDGDDTQSRYDIVKIRKLTRNFAKDSQPSDRIGGLIAEGGSSEVYVCFDGASAFVVKRLVTKSEGIDMIEEQFQSELKMIEIKHPNLVQILGFCKEGPERLIISEYIEGGNLRDKLNKNNDDFSPLNRLKILLGTAGALQYLHYGNSDSEMIHKDVKSVNILLTADFDPKLCDFGLVSANTTTNSKLIGTRAYLAPEAYVGRITPKLDIYAFGIVILETLTGLEPIISTESESIDIKRYIRRELCVQRSESDISPLLKHPVHGWGLANKLYNLAEQCFAELDNRLDSNAVCQHLYKYSTSIDKII